MQNMKFPEEILKKHSLTPPDKQDNLLKKGEQKPMNKSPIDDFKENLKGKSFIDDEVLTLNERLAKHLAAGRADRRKEKDTITQLNKFYNLVRLVAQKKQPNQIKVKLRLIKAQITFATGY